MLVQHYSSLLILKDQENVAQKTHPTNKGRKNFHTIYLLVTNPLTLTYLPQRHNMVGR